jgi:hypothetical protein
MKRSYLTCLVAVFVCAVCAAAFARKIDKPQPNIEVSPTTEVALPPEMVGRLDGLHRAVAAADTFVLHYENFDDGTMSPYVATDFTAQLLTAFHVADATELDGGTVGVLNPLSGAKSMWCGVSPGTTVPYCGWTLLPGYGNDWFQLLQSSPLGGDSLVVSYKVFWDSEPGYDATHVEWSPNGGTWWIQLPVTDSWSSEPELYDGTGPVPYLTETLGDRQTGGNGTVMVRFRFQSDGDWSDEDGLWPTDGALTVDDITLTTWSGSTPVASTAEDFENAAVGSNSSGIWTGMPGPAFGGPSVASHPAYGTDQYAAIYPGVTLLQEDPCLFVTSFVLGFFDHPSVSNYSCHIPDPRFDVGVIPWGTPEGLYMDNEVVSPVFSNTGYGSEYRLEFRVYRDLQLDDLIFYYWRVRSWKAGCPSRWRNDNFVYYGGQKDWLRNSFSIGPRVDPSADGFQVSIGAIDMCGLWCGFVGCGGCCHPQAPLIDDIRVIRVSVSTPQYVVRHLDGLFQDNFAQDGTLTGKSRADAATDIRPATSVNSIVPGDSVTMIIAPVGSAGAGTGPNAYAYARVQNSNHAAVSGAALGSSAVRTLHGYGTRFPFVGTTSVNGITWSYFRMDTTFTTAGVPVASRFCVDLNDNLFVPGDTIFYFYAADADNTPGNGNEGYFTRSVEGQGGNLATTQISAAAASPMEFTILPAGGYNNGGHILYVDDTDDRGGPAQLFWDSALEILGILNQVDRYDVLAPSSAVDNGPASRVKSNQLQIIDVYQTILWDSGDLSSGLVGDGTGAPEKSNDWGLLFTFLNTGTLGTGPGLYLAGDDMAQEWSTLGGSGAIQVRSAYLNFNVLSSWGHIYWGEAVSPHLTAAGPSFIHSGVPDEMIVYGGCPIVNDFDVLDPTGTSIMEYPYPVSGDGAVISQQTSNSVSKTATVVLSGFSYTFIRDAAATFPPARVEFLRDFLVKMGNVVGTPTGVDPHAPQYANALHANYPNPFNPVTTIKYSIKERAQVSLTIYNAAGQVVKKLVDEVQSPVVVQSVTWDGRNDAGQSVASGVYFYKLVTKNFSQTKKMVLLK